MLKLRCLLSLLTPENVRAHLEHKEGLGQTPSDKNLSFTRGCFSDIQKAGCPHPRNSSEIFRSCLDQKIDSLSTGCQDFFIKLYGNSSREKE